MNPKFWKNIEGIEYFAMATHTSELEIEGCLARECEGFSYYGSGGT